MAKVPFSLIPQTAKVFMALGLKHGARKYGPYNWRVEPVQGRVYLEAAERHLSLLLDGEDFDRDTGYHHGCFVLSTMAIYMDAMVQGTLIDNRPLAGRTGDLVAFYNETPDHQPTRSELVAGFRSLTPMGDKLVDSLDPKRISTRYTSLAQGSPTKKHSRKAGKKVSRARS